jgi:glycosyltransferase involved in cell wall biosynthesis
MPRCNSKILEIVPGNDVKHICEYIRENNIDVVWFGYGNISYHLMKNVKGKLPDVKMVCDTDSVWSKFILRELPYEIDIKRKNKLQREGEKKEKEERHWVKFMDVTTAVSEIDASYYKQFTENEKKIKLFSNVIDIRNYEKRPEPEGFKKPSLFISGSFFSETCPMMKGTRWFLKKVFPILKKQIPDVHLYIIGKGSDILLSDVKDSQITIVGFTDSVLPYLTNVDVCLVPLFFESGTRFKILEAGAAGIPIVSTTLGAEGIPVTHGKNILIADSPDSFGQSILKLLDDKTCAKNLAANCRELIENRYVVENLSKEGDKIIKYLAGNRYFNK